MKLNSKMMVAAVMMVGVLGAAGCSMAQGAAAQQDSTTDGQGDSMAQAATSRFGVFFSNVWGGPRYRPLPPAPRYEYPGQAPSRNHVWAHGYWRWDAGQTTYVWAPGYWTFQYAPSSPPAPRYEYPGNPPSERHIWMNGHWQYNGHEYVWVGGHWDVRRDGHLYVQPHWERDDGRWHYVPGHWAS